jgi:hypothetical protein
MSQGSQTKTPIDAQIELLRAVLGQARKEGFARRETLQLAQTLCYRMLELDFRCAEAYLALAYLFCLYQDGQRACQILLHAARLQPGESRIQAMLTQLRFGQQAPLAVSDKGDLALMPLDRLLKDLALADAEVLEQRFASLKPVFVSLDQRARELL